MTLPLTELETSAKLYTVAEFLELDLPETDQEGYPVEYELIRGEIMAKQAGPGGEHGEIVSKLDHELRLYAGKGTDESRQGRFL